MNKIPFDLPQVEHDGATCRGDRGGVLQIFDVGDEDGKISPRQWLLGSVFCRGTLSGLISQGAAGKTTFRILQVIALSSGRNLTGDYIHVRCRVLIICLEDDLPELRRRVRAAMLHHGIKPEDVKGYLFLTTPRDLKIAELDERGRVKAGALYTAIGDVVSQLNLDLVCLDPAIKAHSVDENSNPQIDAFASLLTGLAQTKNIGVDLLSHERKSLGAEAGDANRQRGAGALKDAARLVYTLTTMGKEDAEALGVGEVERKSIFRIDSAKVNIAPPDATTRWFRLIGVHIGNGTADYPSGDNVQACEPWKAAALFDGLTTGDLNKALQKLGAGMGDGRRYSAAPNARDRAAWKAVKDQFPDVEPARCKGIVTIWLKSGVFEIGEYEDAQRKPAVGILSAKLIGEEIS